MEESKKFPSHTTSHAPPLLQTSLGPASENRIPSSVVHALPSEKVKQPPSGSIPNYSSSGHVYAGNTPNLPYQLPQDDTRTSIISGMSDNNYSGRDSSQTFLPKVDPGRVLTEKASNASSKYSQGTRAALPSFFLHSFPC